MSEENQPPSSSNTEENNINSEEEKISSSSSFEEIRLRSLKSSEKINSYGSKEKQKFTSNEALNEYYRLKDKYESVYYDKYIKPIVKNNKSKREKRLEFSRLPKHECINCKRNVGTIFNTFQSKEIFRKFTAKCGDLSDPCPLDIQIDYAFREQMDVIINSGLRQIENIKFRIIKEKNNALFFNEKVVDLFNKLTTELKKETENTGFLIESNILKNNNPEKQLLLKKTIDEFGKEFILPFKEMIGEYMEKNNELKLDEAVKFYINEMIPKLKEIQNAKYDINDVEYHEKYNESGFVSSVYKLIQLPNSLEHTEFFIESDDNVISFVMGVKKGKKVKTMKINESGLKKTRKMRLADELVIEGEDIDIITPKLISKEGLEGLEGIPDFSAPYGVKWDNEKYNEIWKRMPSTLKDMLMTDKEWLQEYVSRCVKSKNTKQPCKLFLPKQAKVPPEELEDGSYDFGIEIINRLFNNLKESHKNTLLTLYSENDGNRNYNILEEALIELLERELKLNTFTSGYRYN